MDKELTMMKREWKTRDELSSQYDAEIDLPFRFISNEEKKRRLECLHLATKEILQCEDDFAYDGEMFSRSPFAGW